MTKNQHNNKCEWHCIILTYLRDTEVDSSNGVTNNDSLYCCNTSILDTRFLLEALCNRISDHHTLLSLRTYLQQHKLQVSKCLPYSMCSYIQRSSKLC
jgi:hypothetical protein